MMLSRRQGCGLAMVMLLAGCAMSPQFAGESASFGSHTLKADVLKSIKNFEQIRQGCRQITSVRSQIVDQKVDGSGRPISSTEVWQIDACGQQSQYQVGLREDGQGGTFINTRRLQP
ncbi:hypothetical protein AB8Q18_08155 [Neisseriaceae bacterium CLB008]